MDEKLYPATWASRTPDKPAYIIAESGESVSYAQLDERSNRCAQLFRAAGLIPGDGIALFMENNPRFLEICWAAQRSGLYYTAVSSRLAASEVEYIVNDCGAKLFISSAALSETADRLGRGLPAASTKLMVGDPIPGFDSYEDRVRAMPAEPVADELEGADMLYSSGTTGRPKGVKLPLGNRPAGTPPLLLALVTALYQPGENTVYLSPAPLYHAAPLRFTMGFQRLGATCVIMKSFEAERALATIEKYRVTHSQWVPTMFVRMLKLPERVRELYDISSLEVAIHAAAPCPVAVKEQMIEWWGPIIHEYYAATEGNGLTAIDSHQWLEHRGSVGKALLGEIHIVDESGDELPPGETGLVYFGGGGRFEYHNDPDKTAKAHNEKGWSTLGDVGYLSEDGYLYLTDRKDHMIISGGVNIYPQETENLIITHPAVQDVAVIGVPNEDFGEEVKAVVQPIDTADAGPELEAEIIDYCRNRLSAIKCPRSVDFEEELPRHPNGKLYKRILKDRYWSGRQSRLV